MGIKLLANCHVSDIASFEENQNCKLMAFNWKDEGLDVAQSLQVFNIEWTGAFFVLGKSLYKVLEKSSGFYTQFLNIGGSKKRRVILKDFFT